MAKKGGKIAKWLEVQNGFTYYSKKFKQNIKVISSDKNKLSYTVEVIVDGKKTTETVTGGDLSAEKKD